MDRRRTAAEARRSLDRTLAPLVKLPRGRPQRGWVRAIRDALGMTAEQLGRRIGVTQSTIQRLETSEASGTIQLNSLRRLAEGLNCELVYALVPRQTLTSTYDAAARAVALRELARVSHSMALEDQAVNDQADDQRLRQFIAEALDPREVWGAADERR
jgi:predicted DNA-binding mobile mystery protein A